MNYLKNRIKTLIMFFLLEIFPVCPGFLKILRWFNNNFYQKKSLKFIQIEPTQRCNFKCIMCPREKLDQANIAEDLSFDKFKILLEKLPKTVEGLILNGQGEPFLNTDLVEMAKYAHEKGFKVIISNNGSKFRKEILPYMYAVIFSLDGVNKNVLENIRRNSRTNEIIETIREAVFYKKENNLKFRIGITSVVSKDNYRDIANIYKFADAVGINDLTVQGIVNPYYISQGDYEQMRKFIEEKKLGFLQWFNVLMLYIFSFYTFALNVWYPVKLKGLCSWNFGSIYVTKDGDVKICCNRAADPQIYGNVFNTPIEEIYNSQDLQIIRKKHLENEALEVCDRCPL